MSDEYLLEVVVAGHVSDAMYRHGHVRPTTDETRAVAREILAIPRISAALAALRIINTRRDLAVQKLGDIVEHFGFPDDVDDKWCAATLSATADDASAFFVEYGDTAEEALLELARRAGVADDTPAVGR